MVKDNVTIVFNPSDNPSLDCQIQEAFDNFHLDVLQNLDEKYGLLEHLGKISISPRNKSVMGRRMLRIKPRLDEFHRLRSQINPENTFITEDVKSFTGL